MMPAENKDNKNTRNKAFYKSDIDLGLDSSTVDVLISLSLFINPLSERPQPAREETEAKEHSSSLSS